jgi:ribonuclease E
VSDGQPGATDTKAGAGRKSGAAGGKSTGKDTATADGAGAKAGAGSKSGGTGTKAGRDGAEGGAPEADDADEADDAGGDAAEGDAPRKRRRRGSRGGRKRSKPRAEAADGDTGDSAGDSTTGEAAAAGSGRNPSELPDLAREGRPATVEAADKALVRKATPAGAPAKPKIGDTRPAPATEPEAPKEPRSGRRRGRGGRSSNGDKARNGTSAAPAAKADNEGEPGSGRRRRRRGRGGGGGGGGTATGSGQVRTRGGQPIEAFLPSGGGDLDDEGLDRRRGRERKGRPVGRYMMCVQVNEKATQIAVLEGRALIEHYVSRPSDDISQIHGNVYLGRVQNVLPGMEAAFVDIGTPKNAVLYRGDVHYDREDVERSGHDGRQPRIEQVLRAGQTILCQVTKNPIGAKGARLTQEVSLPGRFVVLIPNSSTYGISKRLPDDERKRLRLVLDRVKPAQHGIIVRTAAEGVTSDEIENDVRRLLRQWERIDQMAKRSKAPTMLYREPDMAVRVIREEFNDDYRGIVIDDRQLYEQVRDYVGGISPALADRVEHYDPETEPLPLFERHHVHEQIHRALDRKVWLPSGGSLIIEHTEALTVIDVNTGKNVGKSNLEETVFKNNLEAAVEVARQLRLRDIGGIIVVDFIDMERRDNRDQVVQVFRDALSRDKTRTQVFEISELGLCEMTRKRIGEGLLESFSTHCPMCEGRGVMFDEELLPD